MKTDTIALLKECSSGCQMGINSMEQVAEFIEDIKLLKVLDKYKSKHNEILQEAVELLRQQGEQPEKPGAVASMMSWVTTEMKLMMQNDNTQVAKVLLDGCNMGIQTITEKQHQYKEASAETTELAKHLIQLEEEFREELKKFL